MALPRQLSAAQKVVLEYYKAKLNLMHVINARWAAAAAIDLFQRPYANRRRSVPAIWSEARKLKLLSGENKLTGYHWHSPNAKGKQLLIIHGFAGNAKSFDRYISPALHFGYDVVAYDAPAHGKSSGSRLNILTYKWMIEDVIRHHGSFEAYLAHSLGGLALMMALETMGLQHQQKIALVAPLVEATAAADNFFRFLQLPEGLREEFEKELESRAGHPMSWFSMPRVIRAHRGKVLWVHDKDDDTTPFADVKPLLLEEPAHVEFLVTKGLGHSRIYRDSQVRNRVVAFWGEANEIHH